MTVINLNTRERKLNTAKHQSEDDQYNARMKMNNLMFRQEMRRRKSFNQFNGLVDGLIIFRALVTQTISSSVLIPLV